MIKVRLFLTAIIATLCLVIVGQNIADIRARPILPEAQPITYDGASAFGEIPVAQFLPVTGWNFHYNVNSEMVTTTTVTGTVTATRSMALLSTGAGAGQSAQIQTVRALRYIPGQGGLVRFTAIFSTCTAGSSQIVGLGDTNDGLFFGCNGDTFGVLRRQNGVDTWTPKASWSEAANTNIDNILDITKGNVYQIKYQWLGFGQINFYIEQPATGSFELVHAIKYANANSEPSVFNPTLPILARVANTSNSSNIQLKTPSAVAGLDGVMDGPAPIHPFSFYRTVKAGKTNITTETNVVTIRNESTFQGVTNRVRVRLSHLSLLGEGTGSNTVTIQGKKNVTLGGSPSYTAINANTSVTSYDTAGTTVTGGTLVFSFEVGRNIAFSQDLEAFGVELAPGETLTISVTSASAIAPDLNLTWIELF